MIYLIANLGLGEVLIVLLILVGLLYALIKFIFREIRKILKDGD